MKFKHFHSMFDIDHSCYIIVKMDKFLEVHNIYCFHDRNRKDALKEHYNLDDKDIINEEIYIVRLDNNPFPIPCNVYCTKDDIYYIFDSELIDKSIKAFYDNFNINIG